MRPTFITTLPYGKVIDLCLGYLNWLNAADFWQAALG